MIKLIQGNEAEALRSWRSALDQIYYHNAYNSKPDYHPRTETEKALQTSLKDMEIQCKERIDLLEALRDSREEANALDAKPTAHVSSLRTSQPRTPTITTGKEKSGWIGEGTIPAIDYPQLARPGPPLPHRPHVSREKSTDTQSQYPSLAPPDIQSTLPSKWAPPTLPASAKKSRTPSPEKRSRLLTTLRPPKDGKRPQKSSRATS